MKQPLLVTLMLIAASLACNTLIPSATLHTEFQDDFSSSDSGWENSTFDDGGLERYQDGAYRIYVNTPDTIRLSLWGFPDGRFTSDISIEVDVTNLSDGSVRPAYLGVICRYTPTDAGGNFYAFIVGTGFSLIEKVNGYDNTTIITGETIETPPLATGGAADHIRADCIGDTFTLYLNDQLIASATDSDFPGTDGTYIGLAIGFGVGADFLFDNFVVTSP